MKNRRAKDKKAQRKACALDTSHYQSSFAPQPGLFASNPTNSMPAPSHLGMNALYDQRDSYHPPDGANRWQPFNQPGESVNQPGQWVNQPGQWVNQPDQSWGQPGQWSAAGYQRDVPQPEYQQQSLLRNPWEQRVEPGPSWCQQPATIVPSFSNQQPHGMNASARSYSTDDLLKMFASNENKVYKKHQEELKKYQLQAEKKYSKGTKVERHLRLHLKNKSTKIKSMEMTRSAVRRERKAMLATCEKSVGQIQNILVELKSSVTGVKEHLMGMGKGETNTEQIETTVRDVLAGIVKLVGEGKERGAVGNMSNEVDYSIERIEGKVKEVVACIAQWEGEVEKWSRGQEQQPASDDTTVRSVDDDCDVDNDAANGYGWYTDIYGDIAGGDTTSDKDIVKGNAAGQGKVDDKHPCLVRHLKRYSKYTLDERLRLAAHMVVHLGHTPQMACEKCEGIDALALATYLDSYRNMKHGEITARVPPHQIPQTTGRLPGMGVALNNPVEILLPHDAGPLLFPVTSIYCRTNNKQCINKTSVRKLVNWTATGKGVIVIRPEELVEKCSNTDIPGDCGRKSGSGGKHSGALFHRMWRALNHMFQHDNTCSGFAAITYQVNKESLEQCVKWAIAKRLCMSYADMEKSEALRVQFQQCALKSRMAKYDLSLQVKKAIKCGDATPAAAGKKIITGNRMILKIGADGPLGIELHWEVTALFHKEIAAQKLEDAGKASFVVKSRGQATPAKHLFSIGSLSGGQAYFPFSVLDLASIDDLSSVTDVACSIVPLWFGRTTGAEEHVKFNNHSFNHVLTCATRNKISYSVAATGV